MGRLDIMVAEMELQDAKGVKTFGDMKHGKLMSPLSARANFLVSDRMDIQYSVQNVQISVTTNKRRVEKEG